MSKSPPSPDRAAALIVFARAPIVGQVKTRLFQTSDASLDGARAALGRMLSADDAARLHIAFVADVLKKGAQAGFARRYLYVAGALDHPVLCELAATHGYTRRPQAEGDLGARMDAAIGDELAAGASAVVLIGTDSPTLPVAYLRQAARFLAQDADVVLGPAADGGYYLIGARTGIPELFAPGVLWSTATVLCTTLKRLAALSLRGLRTALLPFFYDCDTPDDLRLLRAHLLLSRSQATESGDSETIEQNLFAQAPHTLQALADLALI